ncbi:MULTISPECIES: hypothetical protein [Halomonas]|uniref:hypothetical protein n=1 Tax=Halomonas TaxID=2745 RepID=UPI0011B2085D|nr:MULTISPECIES: hypothetical protein [Halomonas]MBY5940061.1 hypothetical protein [Halomonas sp. DP5N14-9]MCO7216453.1 hypothetical protein [Halomonas sp. OfavH-34-E]
MNPTARTLLGNCIKRLAMVPMVLTIMLVVLASLAGPTDVAMEDCAGPCIALHSDTPDHTHPECSVCAAVSPLPIIHDTPPAGLIDIVVPAGTSHIIAPPRRPPRS